MEIKFEDIRKEHLEIMRNWRNSKEVKTHMYTDTCITPQQQEKWYKNIKARNDERHWVITSNGDPVGVVNLKDIDFHHKTAEWAFYIGNTEHRNTGAATLIEYKLLEYVFLEMKLHKLNCAVLDFNNKVINMHKKFGFQQEGVVRENILKNNRYVSVILLGILDREWRKKREEFKRIIEKISM